MSGVVREGVRVMVGARVVAVVRGEEVRVGLDTGEIVACDLLVGADGVRSTVRRVVFGVEHARFVGAVAWRALAPVEAYADLPASAVVWAGAGRHAVTYRVRRGALINFVGVVEERGWEKEGWDEVGDKAELAAAFEGWAPAVTAVIGAARAVHRWALFEREPIAAWSAGRVVLLGDACHAMPPFQAQGAAMAIEDAVVLGNCVRVHADVEVALARYEALRKVRATKVQASARANMGVFHRSNVVTQAVTYGPMRVAGMVAPAFVRSRQDWIYAYDAQAVSAKG
jgi:salicylate hydroxylase